MDSLVESSRDYEEKCLSLKEEEITQKDEISPFSNAPTDKEATVVQQEEKKDETCSSLSVTKDTAVYEEAVGVEIKESNVGKTVGFNELKNKKPRSLGPRKNSDILAKLYGELNEIRKERDQFQAECGKLSSALDRALELREAGVSIDEIRRAFHVESLETNESSPSSLAAAATASEEKKGTQTSSDYALALSSAVASPTSRTTMRASLPPQRDSEYDGRARRHSDLNVINIGSSQQQSNINLSEKKSTSAMARFFNMMMCACGDDSTASDAPLGVHTPPTFLPDNNDEFFVQQQRGGDGSKKAERHSDSMYDADYAYSTSDDDDNET